MLGARVEVAALRLRPPQARRQLQHGAAVSQSGLGALRDPHRGRFCTRLVPLCQSAGWRALGINAPAQTGPSAFGRKVLEKFGWSVGCARKAPGAWRPTNAHVRRAKAWAGKSRALASESRSASGPRMKAWGSGRTKRPRSLRPMFVAAPGAAPKPLTQSAGRRLVVGSSADMQTPHSSCWWHAAPARRTQMFESAASQLPSSG
jgi:hypothetical protein